MEETLDILKLIGLNSINESVLELPTYNINNKGIVKKTENIILKKKKSKNISEKKLNSFYSVTSLLSKNVEFKNELLYYFQEKFSIKGELLLYKENTKLSEKSVLGMIYDYYLRFKMMEFLGYSDSKIKKEYHNTRGYESYIKSKTYKINSKGVNLNKTFSNWISDDVDVLLFELCYELSIYEEMYRTSFMLEGYGKTYCKNQLFFETKALYESSGLGFLDKEIKTIEFNPKFDNQYICGDGDFIINNTIIELKSGITKVNPIAQLLSYYCLNEMNGGIYKIDKIGVLYPRYNFYIEYNIKDCIKDKEGMVAFFEKAIKRSKYNIKKKEIIKT